MSKKRELLNGFKFIKCVLKRLCVKLISEAKKQVAFVCLNIFYKLHAKKRKIRSFVVKL